MSVVFILTIEVVYDILNPKKLNRVMENTTLNSILFIYIARVFNHFYNFAI